MATKHIIIDSNRHLVAARALEDESYALVLASAMDATHVVSCDETMMPAVVERLHAASNQEALNAELDLVKATEVVARLAKPQYPVNLSREAKPVWDAMLLSERFKKLILGKDLEGQYAVAVKLLHAECKKKGIHPFTTGDAAGSPDASLKEQLKRQVNLCKSYVEQVYRNLLNVHLVTSQENWKNLVVVQQGSMYRVQANKRFNLKRGSAASVESLLRRYESFGNASVLMHKVTSSSRVVMSTAGNHLVVVMGVAMSKAQLMKALDIPEGSRSVGNEANRRINAVLTEHMQSVVASNDDSITAADEVTRFVLRNIVSKKFKMLKQKDKSFIVSFIHKLTGHRPVYCRFVNVDTDTDKASSSFERLNKYSTPKIDVTCNFAKYGLPDNLVPDLDKTPVFDAIKSAVAESITVKQSYASKARRDAPKPASMDSDATKEYSATLIQDWLRQGNVEDVTLPFPQFCHNFIMFFKTRDDAKRVDDMNKNQKIILLNALRKEWFKHQPQTAGSTAKELRVLRLHEFVDMASGDKIKVEPETILRPVKAQEDDESDVWQVVHPQTLFGTRLVLNQDDYLHCANIDNNIDSFTGSMDAAYEMVVENHAQLPTFTSSTGHVGKLLGLAETWKFIDSRAWLHHLNMKVTHKSLTFEKIVKDGHEYLAVILHGDW